MAKAIDTVITTLADKMVDAITANTEAPNTVPQNFAEQNVPEGLPWEHVTQAMDYRDTYAAATHLATGKIAAKQMAADETLTQTVVTSEMHKDKFTSTTWRTKENNAGPKAEDPHAKITTIGASKLHIESHARSGANLNKINDEIKRLVSGAIAKP